MPEPPSPAVEHHFLSVLPRLRAVVRFHLRHVGTSGNEFMFIGAFEVVKQVVMKTLRILDPNQR